MSPVATSLFSCIRNDLLGLEGRMVTMDESSNSSGKPLTVANGSSAVDALGPSEHFPNGGGDQVDHHHENEKRLTIHFIQRLDHHFRQSVIKWTQVTNTNLDYLPVSTHPELVEQRIAVFPISPQWTLRRCEEEMAIMAESGWTMDLAVVIQIIRQATPIPTCTPLSVIR